MIESNIIILQKLKRNRGNIQALANLFSFPGSEFLNVDKMQIDLLELSNTYNNSEKHGKFESLCYLFETSDQQKLMIEFARLFVGPYHVIAPPYGSFYLEDGKLMGDTTIEVDGFYSSAGLAINESFKDLPDHIIAEFEFMLFLIHNEIHFLEKSENESYFSISKLKNEFFNKYLYSWVKKFSALILENSELEFYKESAEFLNSIVDILNSEINSSSEIN